MFLRKLAMCLLFAKLTMVKQINYEITFDYVVNKTNENFRAKKGT